MKTGTEKIVTFEELLEKLAATAIQVDASQHWPQDQFRWLAEADVLKWTIPEAFGGQVISEKQLASGYQKLATACLTTCFALTQRIGACQRIVGSSNEDLKTELLPRLSTGEIFATVGVSHLSTSMQHLGLPAVQVELREDSLLLNGMIPWVTGSSAADYIVTGGTCSDGREILVAMPTKLQGISIQPKVNLMALTSSQTSSVLLENVSIPRNYLLAGPVENVMNQGTGGGAGSLTTSTLALGVASRSLALLEKEAERREELISRVAQFRQDVKAVRTDIHGALKAEKTADEGLTPTAIRQKANSLVLRITQAALAVTKGTGFTKGHPAELAVREGMFFLVWSCPQPVVEGVLNELTCRDVF